MVTMHRTRSTVASWVRNLFRSSRPIRYRRQNPLLQRLVLEYLEHRDAPAVFTGAGPNLAIDLNFANEVATFHTDGTTVFVDLTNGTATTTGTSVTGGGTANASFSSATYNGNITISDS